MEWIIIAALALWLFSRGGANFQAQTAQPVNQATGASLTTALGSASAPPSYFTSGNSQYNAPTTTTQQAPPALPVESQISAVRAPQSPTQISNLVRASELPNRNAPPVFQPVAIRTRVIGPETASAFWTKTPIRVNRPSTL